jgi:uncharacterized protein (TIGR03435 family)
MANLARMLRGLGGVDRPVVDKTGLPGSYRIKTEFDLAMGQRGPDLSPTQNALPTLFAALQEQLGMKLESSTTRREVLVIDRLERPTEN